MEDIGKFFEFVEVNMLDVGSALGREERVLFRHHYSIDVPHILLHKFVNNRPRIKSLQKSVF